MPREHHLETRRTARYFTLGTPSEAVSEVWFVLHGYGQLAGTFIEEFAALDDGRRLIVAPEGLSRFYAQGSGGPDSKVGGSWMTREDRLVEIEDYLRYLDALHDAVFAQVPRERVRLTLLGFSQGTATASRWALRGKGRVDRLVLWAGVLPPDTEWRAEARRLNALGLTFVIGERDEWASGNLALAEGALERAGVSHRLVTFAGGHRMDRDCLRAIADTAPGR